MTMREEQWLKVCAFKCTCCGEVLRREYSSPDEPGGGVMACRCGKITLDPGPITWRLIGDDLVETDVINLCELAEET